MNKIKLLYDIVTTMKEKEVFNGTFKAEAKKGEKVVVSFDNQFEKNISTGQTKAKVSSEVDCGGKKVKHESTLDLTMEGHHEGKHHGFMKCGHFHHAHGHLHGHFHDHIHDHFGCHGGEKGGIFRNKLNKLAFALNILNNVKVEEQEDKSVILSLDLNDFPKDVRQTFLKE